MKLLHKLIAGFAITAIVIVVGGTGYVWYLQQQDEAVVALRLAPQLPQDFSFNEFASGFKKVRALAEDPNGVLIASIINDDRVVALPDRDNDGVADEEITLLADAIRPQGLAFRCREKCELYVGAAEELLVYDYDAENLTVSNRRKIFDFPEFTGNKQASWDASYDHYRKSLVFLPAPNEDTLLVKVAASCNVCVEEDWRRATVLAMNYDGSNARVYASGLRNAAFLEVHPATGEVWATGSGRDFLGDHLPPDEVNIIREGGEYGWPNCYGKNVLDAKFYKGEVWRGEAFCKTQTPTHIDIQAHVTPLGLAFIPATPSWPEAYHHDLLLAYHGSSNSTVPVGFRIARFALDEQGNAEGGGEFLEKGFLNGWLTAEGGIARPVDMLLRENGEMFISDDRNGAIYRVVYGNGAPDDIAPPKVGQEQKNCVISGCSNQLCTEEAMPSTCEYHERYACYQTATCERQQTGNCGWTPTEELSACLSQHLDHN